MREQRLAQVFVELADTLVDEFDVVDFLQVLTERCVELVDTDAAGLMLDDQRGALQVVALHRRVGAAAGAVRAAAGAGPVPGCFATGPVIANIDLRDADNRWPVFAEAARDVGFAHVPRRADAAAQPGDRRAQPVLGRAARPSATNTRRRPGLADIATIGLLHERAMSDQVLLSEQLQTALNSRIVIEQAKGILSAQAGIDVTAAFQLMRTGARRSGTALTAVATAVINGSMNAEQLEQAARPSR